MIPLLSGFLQHFESYFRNALNTINYIGENSFLGPFGHFLIILSFGASLLASFSFFLSAWLKNEEEKSSWKKLARISFLVHGLCVIGIFTVLFTIIQGHYYEYEYAYSHSSNILPMKYLLSCFWEGQEGSFMLWAFWHLMLGTVLIFTSGKWEAPVMFVVAMVQAVIMSMIMGIWILGSKIGSSPFMLLRDTMEAPIFSRPDYLSFLTDGTGLNPLLQNYWMQIHPPVLFLGFASTLVPFAFVIAALWKGDFDNMTRKALPWCLFSMAVFGTGILMGGAWAYESLSFGGFWAWDPVENASLVPWLMLVGGVHTLVIFRHSGHAMIAAVILFILAFLLVLYSSFLTRSGVLGDTSVHAFTALGMFWQLILFLVIFGTLSIIFLFIGWKKIPSPKKEEHILSREFWMFIGALVFMVASIQIIHDTSWPFTNQIINGTLFGKMISAIPFLKDFYNGDRVIVDPVSWYNDIQIWVAVIIGALTGAVQYLRYKSTANKKHLIILLFSFLISVVTTIIVGLILNIPAIVPADILWIGKVKLISKFWILLLFSLFALIANFIYIISMIRRSLKMWGSPIAHMGFALLLLGILFSSYNKRVISINNAGIDFGNELDEKSKRENILLRKDVPTFMDQYRVTYQGDSTEEPNIFYKVKYEKLNENNVVEETFMLYPDAQLDPEMGLVANPSTKHYLTHDVFTHVFSVPDKSRENDESPFDSVDLAVGDTFFTKSSFVILDALMPDVDVKGVEKNDLALSVGADLRVLSLDGKIQKSMPVYFILKSDNSVRIIESSLESPSMKFRLLKINPKEKNVTISFSESTPTDDFIIMKAIIFPGINLVWLGVIVMVSGILLSVYRRWSESRGKSAE